MSENYVRILGARGSAPVSGEQFREFGGATSCVLVKLSGHCLVLDAGSGICSLPAELPGQEELDLILTHLHLDHLIGLPLCPFLLKEGNRMNIHAAVQGKMNLQSLLDRVIGPPYWPVTLDELPAEIKFCSLKEDSLINGIHVETMQGVHPGGISILKLRAEEKTVVFATDCTLTEDLTPKLKSFASGCDLLLIDGQYSDEEWQKAAGYGHSRWNTAAQFAKDCGVKLTRIIHHDPTHTDSRLCLAEAEMIKMNSLAAFARENEEIIL